MNCQDKAIITVVTGTATVIISLNISCLKTENVIVTARRGCLKISFKLPYFENHPKSRLKLSKRGIPNLIRVGKNT